MFCFIVFFTYYFLYELPGLDCEQQLNCGNGACLPQRILCDGQEECGNGVDENKNCTGILYQKFPARTLLVCLIMCLKLLYLYISLDQKCTVWTVYSKSYRTFVLVISSSRYYMTSFDRNYVLWVCILFI